MTEAEWLSSVDPNPMLAYLKKAFSQRRLRLFGVACCREDWVCDEVDSNRRIVAAVEGFADGTISAHELASFEAMAQAQLAQKIQAVGAAVITGERAYDDARIARLKAGAVAELAGRTAHRAAERSAWYIAEAACITISPRLLTWDTHARLLREIFGNPFRPVTIDSAWLTSTVTQLAIGMYDERAFDQLPILADALQDAGCDRDDLLNHLRDPNATHVRGCWALDLVLGKE